MLYYKQFNFNQIKCKKTDKVRHKKEDYSTNIYALDIETSTVFIDANGKQHQWQNPYNEEQRTMYKNCHKYAFMYLWQFAIKKIIEDKIYILYGRTWEEYGDLLNRIEEVDKYIKKIWVHNLSYEYQFLLNIDETLQPFARATRKVLNAKSSKWNVHYFCTLALTNLKLEKLPQFYGTPTQKLVDNMNYDIIRTSDTELTQDVLDYAENDVIILCEIIQKECEKYGNVTKIPMTSTSKIRKEIKQLFAGDMKHYKQVMWASPKTADGFKLLMDCYAGGYTHANCYTAGNIIENIKHVDFASSYPAVLVYEKYPQNEFKKLPFKPKSYYDLDTENYAYIFKFKAKNVKSKYENNFISYSKAKNVKLGNTKANEDFEVYIDNGRIITCDYMELTCTDVDFFTYLKAYEMDIVECEIYYSFKYYLPKKLVLYILDLYHKKATLKDAPAFIYNNIKAGLNGIYGCSVTNNIASEVIFDINNYNEETGRKEIWKMGNPLTDEEIEEQLKYQYFEPTKCRNFLPICVGVWCSAYARANLLNTVMQIEDAGARVHYCDTDSIFADNTKTVQKIIDKVNADIVDKIEKICYTKSIDIELTRPTHNGKTYQLGIFTDEDDTGGNLKSFGAKKYAVEHNGKIKTTISGVAKSACKYINTLDDFEIGFLFDEKMSGKKTLFYNDEQTEIDVVDYQGHTTHITEKYAISMMGTTYKLGLGDDYETCLQMVATLNDRSYFN